MALTDKLTAIGDAIREKEGSTDLIALGDMPERIMAIQTGGGSTVTGSEMLYKMMMDGVGYYEPWTFVVPSGVTQIRNNLFENTYYLADMEYEDESQITTIGSEAFLKANRFNPSHLPSNLTTIKSYAFSQCQSLALKELPSTLTTLEYGAFQSCYALQLTTLPEGVESINNYTFSNAFRDNPPSLFTLPSKVFKLGVSAFENVRIPKIRMLSTPGMGASISNSAFKSTYITDIYVPWMQTHVASTNAPWGATNATIHYETPVDEVIE